MILWGFVAVLACLPFVGIGIYFDETRTGKDRCVRYRFAHSPTDRAYAYLNFAFGEAFSIFIFLFLKGSLLMVHAIPM